MRLLFKPTNLCNPHNEGASSARRALPAAGDECGEKSGGGRWSAGGPRCRAVFGNSAGSDLRPGIFYPVLPRSSPIARQLPPSGQIKAADLRASRLWRHLGFTQGLDALGRRLLHQPHLIRTEVVWLAISSVMLLPWL